MSPHLHRPLPTMPALSSAQWRCLRVLGEVGDVAHAARKLHCSQAALKDALAELQAHLDSQHLAVSQARVHLSPALREWLRQQGNRSPGAAAQPPRSKPFVRPVPVPSP